jgi:RNA polymerase sigma-70 factor (ECF subfamily)
MSISINLKFVNLPAYSYLAQKSMLTDQELIEGCKRGSSKAQKELYSRYSGAMLGISMRYCRNKSEAEDVLQEAFIRIFRYIVKFEGRNKGSLSAWIKTIVINTTLSNNRNNLKHHFTEDVDDIQVGETPIFDILNEVDESQIKVQKIMKSIQKLPDGYRTVFNLYCLEGYSHKEIAEILNVSENTSKSQLSKARKYLRKLLGIIEVKKKQNKWIAESLMV